MYLVFMDRSVMHLLTRPSRCKKSKLPQKNQAPNSCSYFKFIKKKNPWSKCMLFALNRHLLPLLEKCGIAVTLRVATGEHVGCCPPAAPQLRLGCAHLQKEILFS